MRAFLYPRSGLWHGAGAGGGQYDWLGCLSAARDVGAAGGQCLAWLGGDDCGRAVAGLGVRAAFGDHPQGRRALCLCRGCIRARARFRRGVELLGAAVVGQWGDCSGGGQRAQQPVCLFARARDGSGGVFGVRLGAGLRQHSRCRAGGACAGGHHHRQAGSAGLGDPSGRVVFAAGITCGASDALRRADQRAGHCAGRRADFLGVSWGRGRHGPIG